MINVTLLAYSKIASDGSRRLDDLGRRILAYLEEVGLTSASQSRTVVTGRSLLINAGRLEDVWRTDEFQRSDLGAVALGTPPVPVDGTVSPRSTYEDLINRLKEPSRLASLLPPFFAAYVLPDRCGVVTDYLGVGRAYTFENDSLWVASNHIASCLIAADRVEQAEDWMAWQIFSGIGWFPLDTSPYHQLRRIAPASTIEFDKFGRKTVSQYFPYEELFDPSHRTATVSTAAEQMIQATANLGSLSKRPLRAHLSGGRDSRVTAAATLRAGIDCTVVTFGTISEEAETARLLMRRERSRPEVEHEVLLARQRRPRGSIAERGMRSMEVWDGDMNPNRLSLPAVGRQPTSISIGGGGGEIAHGNYYATTKMLDRVKSMDRPTDRLVRAFGGNPGVTNDSAAHIKAYLDDVHDSLVQCGMEGPSILDGFYLAERTRRWVAAGHNNVSPLLYGAPQFVVLAMRLTPHERLGGQLQRELLGELAPRWADVPFFKASATEVDQVEARGLRLWQGEHADEFFARMKEGMRDPLWDEVSVAELATQVLRGVTERRMESTFQKILWRQSFLEHRERLRQWAATYQNNSS